MHQPCLKLHQTHFYYYFFYFYPNNCFLWTDREDLALTTTSMISTFGKHKNAAGACKRLWLRYKPYTSKLWFKVLKFKFTSICHNLSLKNVFSSLVKRCSDPGFPENGFRAGSLFLEGTQVRFSCNPGYEIVGHSGLKCVRMCKSCTSVHWNSTVPICRKYGKA